MGFDGSLHVLGISLQIFLIDILLSGDNAVVIALVCRALPKEQRRQAMIYGAGAGIVLRVLLTLVASFILELPLLKIVGAVALLLIAIDLMTKENELAENLIGEEPTPLSSVVMTIVTADLVMSLDNVVALAAVSQGNVGFLTLGLVLSVPLLIFGSGMLANLMDGTPELITLGGALLGWVAGSIAVSDPLLAHWIDIQSPALTLVVPFATALLAVMQSRRLVAERRAQGPLARPAASALPIRPPRPEAAAVVHAPIVAAAHAEKLALDRALAAKVDAETQVADRGGTAADAEHSAASAPATGARWDIAIPVGLAVFIAILVVVIFAATDNEQPSSPWKPNLSFEPTPQALERFSCLPYESVIFYNHGSTQVKLQAGNTALSGILVRNRIMWEKPPANVPPIGFDPPTRVIDDDAKSVTVEGGSFPRTVCRLEQVIPGD